MRIKSAIFFIILLLVVPVGLSAQILLDDPDQEADTPAPDIPAQIMFEGYERADRLRSLGEYEKAADLLEVILEKNPNNIHIKNMLADCYERSKNYDKLILFLRQRLTVERQGYQLLRALGQAYILSGRPDSAQPLFYMAAEKSSGSERAYASIAEIYHKLGHYRMESEFIDSVRVLTGDSTLMADRMGDALSAQKQFGAATLEYLAFMQKDTSAVRATTQRLEAMMTFPKSADTVMAILSDRIKAQSHNKYLLNTYGQLLLQQNRYDEAFSFFISIDSLEAGSGGSIIHFMRQCNDRKRFDYTLKAGEYFLQFRPESPLKNNVLFTMAEALTATERFDEALAAYQSITRDLIRPAHRAEAQLKIGLLYKDYLGDFAKAADYFRDVTRNVPTGPFDVLARFGLADLAIKEKNLDSAISLYQSVQEYELPEDYREKVDYSLAEIYLFKAQYNEATSRYRQVISRYPRGFYVNEAIQYSLIIGEALEDAPKQIDLFSSAEYFRYTGQKDSLEYYLTKICRVAIPSLAPVSYVRLAQLFSGENRLDEAVAAVDSLVSLYPRSYFFPYGLKLKADIYLKTPEKREEAVGIYRTLLENYSSYPFAAEVRDIIRREMPADRI